jgi:hypothetical protein
MSRSTVGTRYCKLTGRRCYLFMLGFYGIEVIIQVRLSYYTCPLSDTLYYQREWTLLQKVEAKARRGSHYTLFETD